MGTLPVAPSPRCGGLTKHGHRLISTLHAAGNPASVDPLIRKFVAASSKSVALSTLSHLLSLRNSSAVLPMYRRISQAPWYKWNSKLLADVAALLHKNRLFQESESLISDSVQNLSSRDLALLHCDLIESYSRNESSEQALNSFSKLKQIPSIPTSVRRQGYGSMINGFCSLDLPQEAERIAEEMEVAGFRVSPFEQRKILLCYGRLGFISEMQRLIDQMRELDTVTANMVLSCYGHQSKLIEMVLWLRKMKDLEIEFSIRTYNSVLNSCPGIAQIIEGDCQSLPLSIQELLVNEFLSGDEVLLIKELIGSRVLLSEESLLEWSSSEAKLELHEAHPGSAYVILLQWVEEVGERFRMGSVVLPSEISVVCGIGKNSRARGESPVKKLVSEMMFRLRSPLKIDRKNVGRFVGRGNAVKEWLSKINLVDPR